MITATNCLLLSVVLTFIPSLVNAFTPSPFPPHLLANNKHTSRTKSIQLQSSPSPTSSPSPINKEEEHTLFPVLNKISGVEWNGQCRYVNADLHHASNLKLVGGIRYDINGTTCTLSSFLTFPNGKTREVVMKGIRDVSSKDPSLRLDSTATDGGPVYMKLTELAPDTILINEIEKASGKIIMTSSVSIVNEGRELVQVSHEVGDGGKVSIEGHQVWRLKQVPIEYDDFAARTPLDTTAR